MPYRFDGILYLSEHMGLSSGVLVYILPRRDGCTNSQVGNQQPRRKSVSQVTLTEEDHLPAVIARAQ